MASNEVFYGKTGLLTHAGLAKSLSLQNILQVNSVKQYIFFEINTSKNDAFFLEV